MKIKTSELTGAALDWAVATCEGVTILPKKRGGHFVTLNKGETVLLRYSTDWAQGGPIIEREEIALELSPAGTWYARIDLHEGDAMVEMQQGTTPLIAAMRCYCCAELGDEIDIPEELQ